VSDQSQQRRAGRTELSTISLPAGAARIGKPGAGVCEGPGSAAVTGGLAKNFAGYERRPIGFDAMYTNVLRHPNFAAPSVDLSTPGSFGATETGLTQESACDRVWTAFSANRFPILQDGPELAARGKGNSLTCRADDGIKVVRYPCLVSVLFRFAAKRGHPVRLCLCCLRTESLSSFRFLAFGHKGAF
jgi:hypothetical protein